MAPPRIGAPWFGYPFAFDGSPAARTSAISSISQSRGDRSPAGSAISRLSGDQKGGIVLCRGSTGPSDGRGDCDILAGVPL